MPPPGSRSWNSARAATTTCSPRCAIYFPPPNGCGPPPATPGTAALAAILTPGHPRTKECAYAGLVFVYGGAATSHLAAGDGPDKWAMP
ncbi:DoxX family protein, partial [Nocardia abscessus]|uniref:DoxX family protein n=1 Tax=Nocardia abscessus TaxID=120957 RepID=UPI002457217A